MSQSVVSRFWIQSGQDVLYVESGVTPSSGDTVVIIPDDIDRCRTEVFSNDSDCSQIYGRVIMSVTLSDLRCINQY
ncbi:MAG: hypothetical protein ACR2PT_03170 [Endozoicomonas sp.]